MVSTEPINILVLDDEEIYAKNIKIKLEGKGYKCTICMNYNDAFIKLKSEKFDIFIVDYYMPDISGEKVIELTRKQYKNIYIIMYTSQEVDMPGQLALRSLDIDNYAIKSPEGLNNLLIAIEVAKKSWEKSTNKQSNLCGLSFEEKLRVLREGKKVTQANVAEYLGISTNAYGAYEKGISKPPYENIKGIAEYFGITCGELMD